MHGAVCSFVCWCRLFSANEPLFAGLFCVTCPAQSGRRSVHRWVMTNVKESWLAQMSHGSCECVMTHLRNVSSAIRANWRRGMSHGPYERVMAHMNQSWHIQMNHDSYERVMAYINVSWLSVQMSHGSHKYIMAHMTESWLVWRHNGSCEWSWLVTHLSSLICHNSCVELVLREKTSIISRWWVY